MSQSPKPTSPRSSRPAPATRETPPSERDPKRNPIFWRAVEILRREFKPRAASTPAAARDTSPPAKEDRPLAPAPASPAPAAPPSQPFTGSIPARMLNEFVYCPRLFYYEFVEGVFLHNADTVRGATIHKRVDKGEGALPAASGKRPGRGQPKSKQEAAQSPDSSSKETPSTVPAEPELIHSRSVQMGSKRLGVTAKMDLVEVRKTPEPGGQGDLFALVEVCPVDYKVGSPRPGTEGNELWDADRMQLGLQCLILRDNGYICQEGIIYYRGTRQRVRLPVTPELEGWILDRITAARQVASGAIPPPLAGSPKCPRCSLVTICLPDETRHAALEPDSQVSNLKSNPPRRLIAARDDARALYLNTQGLRIGRADQVLQIRQERTTLDEVRISDLTHVALFGNIQITTQAIQTLCSAEVPVTYFSMGGWFYGLTRGHTLKNVFLRIEQFRLARDPLTCRRLARAFVWGKIRNQRTMLMRNHVEAPAPTLNRLREAAGRARDADSLEQLLGIEGAAARLYFGDFAGMIKVAEATEVPEAATGTAVGTTELGGDPSAPDARRAAFQFTFNFHGRNRRPPTDPVNALLSLGYSLLAKDCLLAALAVGFDPYVGFFHQPRFGRPALALDLMEEFRPLVADSTVLNCINNRVLTGKDFVRAGEAVNLTTAGRRRFFQLYEQRMNSLLTHPVFDYKVSYRRALELQARLLAKVLTGEIPDYLPLTTR